MEPTGAERAETARLRNEFEKLGNLLTYSMDVMREYLLGNIPEKGLLPFLNFNADTRYIALREQNDKLYVKVDPETMAQVNQMCTDYHWLNNLCTRVEPPTKRTLARIEKAQIAHRDDDLRRILRTAASADDRDLMRKALACDVTKPLEPQLGFDPNEV